MNYPDINKLNSGNCVENSIKKHYPSFWEHLINQYPKDLSWSERLYWFYHNITDYPKCKVCDSIPGFINFRVGYKTYCSKKCSNNDPSKKDKTKQTCLERYGGVAPASSINVRNKMSETTLRKYGVANIQQLSETVKKSSQTCLERYGGRGNASRILKDKYIKTCNDRYGADNPMQNDDVKNRVKSSVRRRIR